MNEKIMELRIKLMREHFGTWDSEGKVIDFRDVLDSGVNERLEKIAEVHYFLKIAKRRHL